MQITIYVFSKCTGLWYGCASREAIYHLRSAKGLNDKYCRVDKLRNVNAAVSKQHVLIITHHLWILAHIRMHLL